MARALWPRSLQGQLLLAIALALLAGQGLSAMLIWRAQHERRAVMLVNSAAFRLLGPVDAPAAPPGATPAAAALPPPEGGPADPSPLRARIEPGDPARAGDRRLPDAEHALAEMLAAQGYPPRAVLVAVRDLRKDPPGQVWLERHRERLHLSDRHLPSQLIVAAMERPDGRWVAARLIAPHDEGGLLASFLAQTVLLYLVLVSAVALILRRITRPLAALTARVERFARERTAAGQLAPSGPADMRRLIAAHNAMENGIARLLDEKDVMLGAIGHDLKTPLAALRVRIEAVEDDGERGRMAAGIADINRSLDDILSLARVGRPSDPVEPTELGALTAAVVEEFEDMGDPVTLIAQERIVLPLRPTWLRRALRNLIANAVRYGARARVSLLRDAGGAVLRIEDDGPGIPEAEIARMMEPFTRLEASRNSATGGAGLGLALARAIAEQHGGALVLANRRGADGAIAGLSATLRLPPG